MRSGYVVSPRFVAMALSGVLVYLTLAVAGENGGLLVRGRRPEVRAPGVKMSDGGRLVRAAGPLKRLFGTAPRTLHALLRDRKPPGQLVAPLPQLVSPRAGHLGPRLGAGVVGAGILACSGHRFLHDASSYA